MCAAIVHSSDGVHLVASGPEELALARVGEYVRSRAEYQLWPEDATRVHELLRNGCAREAVDLYFARVGDRWDRESLFVHEIDLGLELRSRQLR